MNDLTLSGIRLIQGDCLKVLPSLPDDSVDAVICDLPYGTTACKWDVIIPFWPMWKQFRRVCRGAVVLFATEPFTSALIAGNYQGFKENLTWVKPRPSNIGNARIRHLRYSEDIAVFADGGYTFNPQYTERVSDRVRQMQKGGSSQWRSNRASTGKVSFATEYGTRDWHSFDADRKLQGMCHIGQRPELPVRVAKLERESRPPDTEAGNPVRISDKSLHQRGRLHT